MAIIYMVEYLLKRLFVTVTDISRQCQPEKLIPLLCWPGFDPSFSGHNDEQSSASGQDYASDRSAIGAGIKNNGKSNHQNLNMNN